MLRIFGRNKLYLKNSTVIESLASVDTIVFDKTGTITQANESVLEYTGKTLSETEINIIKHISNQSSHPLSRIIASNLKTQANSRSEITEFKEYTGKGISAIVNNIPVKMGSAIFIGETNPEQISFDTGTHVHVQIGNDLKGRFSINNLYRMGIKKEISNLKNAGYELHVLSGDNNSEKENLQYIFDQSTPLKFSQTPVEKLEYIRELQQTNKKVLMIGDGLNDSGALMQADVGIAVNDHSAQFTPACDAILDAGQVKNISQLAAFAKAGKKIVTASFILSILYNIAGLSFAVSASLSPLVAAILMPASSISIVLFVTLASNLKARQYGL
jgi:Cu+-exporting ATPase